MEWARLVATLARYTGDVGLAEETDWVRITELYGILAGVMPSPVVELNRAVALSMAFGPQAGLDLVDQLVGEPSLRGYHLLASVRGDLLMKLGRAAEARAEFERAAELTRNGPERELTAARAEQARRDGQLPARL
jgi:predicted RNA polymerase sigma factor